MIDNLCFIFIINVFINSVLVFLTSVVFVELILFITQVHHRRLRAFCRCVPLLKLPLSLLFYNFSNWALARGINPLLCGKGTRTLYATLSPWSANIQMTVCEGQTFSVADLFALNISCNWLYGCVFTIFMVFLLGFLFKIGLFTREWQWLKSLQMKSLPCRRMMTNTHLAEAVRKSRIKICVVSENLSPFAAGFLSRRIVLSQKHHQKLSQDEYEAVIAHEIEHLRWFDPFIKFCCHCICSLFWWIPTQWWLRRIQQEWEFSCDESCQRASVDPKSLASAIVKVGKQPCFTERTNIVCFARKYMIKKRIALLLQPITKKKLNWFSITKICSVSILTMELLLGKIWIF